VSLDNPFPDPEEIHALGKSLESDTRFPETQRQDWMNRLARMQSTPDEIRAEMSATSEAHEQEASDLTPGAPGVEDAPEPPADQASGAGGDDSPTSQRAPAPEERVISGDPEGHKALEDALDASLLKHTGKGLEDFQELASGESEDSGVADFTGRDQAAPEVVTPEELGALGLVTAASLQEEELPPDPAPQRSAGGTASSSRPAIRLRLGANCGSG